MSHKTVTLDLSQESSLSSSSISAPRRNRTRKAKKPLFNATQLKEKLLQRIKQYQYPTTTPIDDDDPASSSHSELQESMDFLEQLVPKSNASSSSGPPFGNLKNGSKPTFRTWNQQQQLQQPNPSVTPSISTTPTPTPQQVLPPTPPQVVLTTLPPPQVLTTSPSPPPPPLLSAQPPLVSPPVLTTSPPPPLPAPPVESIQPLSENDLFRNFQTNVVMVPFKQIRKKTIKRKFNLGKHKDTNTVSVLIKDNKTRKRDAKTIQQHRDTPIGQMKQYLKQHNLIKVGSNAPSDVIRQMYEASLASGDIENQTVDTVLHNFEHDHDF